LYLYLRDGPRTTETAKNQENNINLLATGGLFFLKSQTQFRFDNSAKTKSNIQEIECFVLPYYTAIQQSIILCYYVLPNGEISFRFSQTS